MSKQFTKLKVYELGGGVAFQTETGAVPFLVLPKGQATMKPWGTSGFVFEKVVTGDVIAFVDTFDDLLDSAGVAWGISQAAVFTAVGAFFFELAAAGSVPFYANSVWTSFQMDAKAVSTTNLGSNSAYAVGFNVPVATRIKNAQIECTVWVGNVNAEFALYKVENGIATERIYRDEYLITGTGYYTFAVNLDLEPGNYAYAVNQDLIMGYRTISNPDNIFGVDPLGGANVFPWAKTAVVVAAPFLPDPFPVGQTNYNSTPVPLAIFEIEIL